MKKKQQKKGISLVVLVITIIIMIILATTIIISLSNNGIIDKAQEAVDKTNEREVQELANTAWARAYSKGVRTKEEYKSYVEEALKNNNINLDEYNIKVTTSGVTVSRKNGEGNTEEDGDNVEEKEVWIQKADRTVVKGDIVLNIGDYIDYVSGVEGYTDKNGWRVLGAENGELLIMSSVPVKSSYTLGSYSDFSISKTDYENGISKLNEICAPYGNGAYAIKARSITIEDVDRVTGYDKTTYEYTIANYKFKYGVNITYYWDNTIGKEDYPYYIISGGLTGNLNSSYSSGFTYYNGKEWITSTKPSSLKAKQEICTLTQTYYSYNAKSATDLKTVAPDAYNMLFCDEEEQYSLGYWLASTYCNQQGFGFFRVITMAGNVTGTIFEVTSDGRSISGNADVMAVVHLSSDYTPKEI